ncbi:MAG: Nif3-like dinuclear metal center hexameric protein [bacterium]
MKLADIVSYLDRYLDRGAFSDASVNGLQVENSGSADRIALAVDACLESIEQASRQRCNLLLVHHGILWSDPAPVCGVLYGRIRALLEADIALYAAHLPLDAHPEVGNNAEIARLLGLSGTEPFGTYGPRAIGVQGRLAAPASLGQIMAVVSRKIGVPKTLLRFGPHRVSRVGIVSGSASDLSFLEEANRVGLDLFLTGEAKEAAYDAARELGLNVLFAGHYRTETFGVKALGRHLQKKFKLPVHFFRTGCPF